MKRTILLAIGLMALLVVGATTVLADQVYHSERLDFNDLSVIGHPPLRHGQVVNIHPNGPVNGALERYMVNGAKPNTSYSVRLDIILGCVGDPVASLDIPGTLDTNNRGVGHHQGFFATDDLPDPTTVGIRWNLRAAGELEDAYRTDCTIVVID